MKATCQPKLSHHKMEHILTYALWKSEDGGVKSQQRKLSHMHSKAAAAIHIICVYKVHKRNGSTLVMFPLI